MFCSILNCKTSEANATMIDCWICDNLFHIKCIDIPGRVADVLAGNRGLRWCCADCKQIDIDFYKFIKSNRNKFNEIKKEFSVISNKLVEYEEIFKNFKSLDKLCKSPSESPKPKRASKRIAAKSNETPIQPESDKQTASNNQTAKPDDTPTIQQALNNQTEIKNQVDSQILNLNQSELSNEMETETDLNSASSSVQHQNTSQQRNIAEQSTQLKIIPPKKSIFISRFAYDTSEDQINSYITNKLKCDSTILIKKFKYSQPRDITSFKITVPADLFEQILDSNFWPDNALVRKYELKENPRRTRNNIVQLPLNNPTNSKN